MAGMDKIRACMASFLDLHGVRAVTAWSGGARCEVMEPTAAVTLKSCSGGPAGFRDYLGERYDQESGTWQELYGKRVKAVFGLDFYAPAETGEAGCQAAFDALAEAFQRGGPTGLTLLGFSRGKMGYDRETGLLMCEAEAVCEAYLYAVADEGGTFLDFQVKGDVSGHDGT